MTVQPRISAVTLETTEGPRVVQSIGEVDLATRSEVESACVAGGDVDVVAALGEVTLMDCAGYRGLVAARDMLRQQGSCSPSEDSETSRPDSSL